ncbi:MAG TPA: adenylate/guanylate cyclase domain-containing protein [Methylomirabilota bacterium]|nr:adenylate/guanylate cyclase domain-containing protein [Methylomirabilota bacterium]
MSQKASATAAEPTPPTPRPRGMRLPLKVKLSLVIIALVFLTVSLVSAFLIRQEQLTLTAEMTKRGLTIAENLSAGAKSSLLASDELTLNVLVKDAMKDPDVAYVAIADENGTVLAHSDVGEIGKPITRPAGLEQLGSEPLVRMYKTNKGEVIDFAMPLVFSDTPVGALYLGFSKQTITNALAHAFWRAVVITGAMVVVGVLGAIGLSNLLSRPIFRLVRGTRAIAEGDFNVALPVTSRDELGTLTESFNQMARSLREKEMIKHAFTRYVAREVVEEILKDPEHLVLTGERREATVLFCDIRGFTPLSERMSPEDVVLLLNEFYALMIETVFKHDGTLDKFLGDAVMAVFGAPIAHPDHAVRAVRTAIAMQEGITALNEARAKEGKERIQVGIGVSVGEVVAGTVGSGERMEYTVIGDSVNLASRLESNAKPGRILISERTYDKVRNLVEVVPLGPIKVKGKEEQVEVFELVGHRGRA